MEIKGDRMVYLGYGKYWRSDEIVGLLPIEEGRGPGRRTEVYVATRDEPVVASRSEQTILQAMAGIPDELSRAAEARSVVEDLLLELSELSPVLRRMLKNEGDLDVDGWIDRLRRFMRPESESEEGQESLFSG
ncbi:MAG: hypothetical protein ACE5HF_02880 [Gemmatimonadota bacterium]